MIEYILACFFYFLFGLIIAGVADDIYMNKHYHHLPYFTLNLIKTFWPIWLLLQFATDTFNMIRKL